MATWKQIREFLNYEEFSVEAYYDEDDDVVTVTLEYDDEGQDVCVSRINGDYNWIVIESCIGEVSKNDLVDLLDDAETANGGIIRKGKDYYLRSIIPYNELPEKELEVVAFLVRSIGFNTHRLKSSYEE